MGQAFVIANAAKSVTGSKTCSASSAKYYTIRPCCCGIVARTVYYISVYDSIFVSIARGVMSAYLWKWLYGGHVSFCVFLLPRRVRSPKFNPHCHESWRSDTGQGQGREAPAVDRGRAGGGLREAGEVDLEKTSSGPLVPSTRSGCA